MKAVQGTISGLSSNCDKDLIYDLLEQHYHNAPVLGAVQMILSLLVVIYSKSIPVIS